MTDAKLPDEPQETAWREWNRQPDGTYEEDQIGDDIGHTDFIGGWDAAAAHYATRLREVEQERDALAAQIAEAPHHGFCRSLYSPNWECDCWKSNSPTAAVARLRAETLEEAANEVEKWAGYDAKAHQSDPEYLAEGVRNWKTPNKASGYTSAVVEIANDVLRARAARFREEAGE